jgi:hypothetical protein
MIWFSREMDVTRPMIDMSSNSEHPYCRLSFDYQVGQIPVPGFEGMYAESLNGMMEALMLTGRRGMPGKVNLGFLVGPGRERKLGPDQWCTGYMYRGRSVDLAEARRLILIPSYLWVLSHKAGQAVAKVRKRSQDGELWLYDGCDSADINSPMRLSAAATLAAYLSGQLQQFQEGWPIFEH